MKSTRVDRTTGDVVCPVCGARNSFTVKRTAKAKWTAGLTVGVGALVMPKRLSCNGCGANLKRGGDDNVAPVTDAGSPDVLLQAPGNKKIQVITMVQAAGQESQPPSLVVDLERLAALYASGALSDDEFQAAKRRLLES